MTTRKTQKGGKNSTNVQAETLNLTVGLSLEEVTKLIQAELAAFQSGKGVAAEGPIRFHSGDLLALITAISDVLADDGGLGKARYDFLDLDLEQKNELNKLGHDYFSMMQTHHEPHFYRIDRFLKDPKNGSHLERYHDIVDDLRSQLSANGGHFESFEQALCAIKLALSEFLPDWPGAGRLTNVLLSYMYFTCDIGKKA
ncbi:MAG: ABC-three component system protein [Pseudomonadota bacterium]